MDFATKTTNLAVEYFADLAADGAMELSPAEQGNLSTICLRVGHTVDGRLILALLPRHAPPEADAVIRAAVGRGSMVEVYHAILSQGGRLALSTRPEGADA